MTNGTEFIDPLLYLLVPAQPASIPCWWGQPAELVGTGGWGGHPLPMALGC